MIHIKKSEPYYVTFDYLFNHFNRTGTTFLDDGTLKMKLVNEVFNSNMKSDTWYLLPQAYSLTLKKKKTS